MRQSRQFLLWTSSLLALAGSVVFNDSLVRTHANAIWLHADIAALSFAFTFFLMLGASLACAALLGSFSSASFVIGGSYVFLGFVSSVKRHTLGSPLFPTDFHAAWDMERALHYDESLKKGLLFIFCCSMALIFILVVLKQIRNWNKSQFKPRVAQLFSGLLLVGLLALQNNPLHDRLFAGPFQFDQKSPFESMSTLGQAVSFIALVEQGNLIPPLRYSQNTFQNLWNEIELEQAQRKYSAPLFKPDIVVVMSESLYDPTQLPGIIWKRDPLKFTRSLSTENINRLVISTYGGKTATPEFGFLTGHNQRFFNIGTVAYNSLISAPMSTIPSQLGSLGYHTVAIHPGYRQFWNRDQVYSFFGFHKFVSAESFQHPAYMSDNITDESILPMLKQSMEKDTGPQFRFIVTIQNHWPFHDPFDLSQSAFETSGLTNEEQVVLNHYVHGLEATDHFHESLVSWLNSRQRPTVLMIFGDHLPALLPDYGVYKGRVIPNQDQTSWSEEQLLNMYRTPLVLWSNFHLPFPTGNISVSFAGVRLLEAIGLPLTPYQNFVAQLSTQIPIFTRFFPKHLNANEKDLVQKYWILQHGIMLDQEQGTHLSSKSPH